ncbi:dTDP-4-dehydrorhamnose 3,5-epimerase [Bacillus mesophilum]|uniref:dTDP-4-dehydrorhamnose 3,5-epimerase n=1 Tax=Bacillus mesophilum TaxID=1071718 RepID=A0A7V7RQ98_9BACI|nr:dTDP-4-dehydrorhamnose 3,5-epimerase [Bacillus mesophilum]KAB2335580.1 dTDP-4-dehydrorhamnose 3,5-epimerase [Bacillus mesophilum]
MKVIKGRLPGLLLIEPKVYEDTRGFFLESYNEDTFKKAGIEEKFIQDNHSLSLQAGVIRGLHYQLAGNAQTKLVRVITGAIYDVVVDLRKGSPTFGEWESFILSEDNKRQLYVPKGFAHGFCTITANVHIIYKVDNWYSKQNERGLAWNDNKLSISWPTCNPILSDKDKNHPELEYAENDFQWEEAL